MKITVQKIDMLTVATEVCLVIPVPLSETETVLKLKKKLDEGKPLQLELKPLRKARTLSANSFAWSLCEEIAVALSKNGVYHSKEDVYRNAIKDCGVNQFFRFSSEEAMKRFASMWARNGIGWVVEELGNNELIVYFGSSTYDRAQMARLIDCLVAEAKTQGIRIKASDEIEKMVAEWGK